MLIIRLARRGRTNSPFYDIVVAEKSRPVQKKFVTKLGYYNPLADKGAGELVYDKDLTVKYIQNGAQMSQATARLLTKDGLKEAGKFVVARVSKPKKEAPKPDVSDEAEAKAEPVESSDAKAVYDKEAVDEAPAAEAAPEETATEKEETPTESTDAEVANDKEEPKAE